MALPNLRTIVFPKSLDEALKTLREYPGTARPLAGGTALTQQRDERIEILVDISRIGLDDLVETENGLSLGACATSEQVASWPPLARSWAAALADACRMAGPAGVRNAMTLGGSLVQCFPWADPPVALLALDASVHVKERGTVSAQELLAQHPQGLLDPWHLVTEIRLERPKARAASAFLKESETATTYAVASAAVRLDLSGDSGDTPKLGRIRVAVGAVRSLPFLVDGLEDLAGQPVDEALAREVGRRAAEQTEPLMDMRASKSYRRKLVAVLVRRVVVQAMTRLAETN